MSRNEPAERVRRRRGEVLNDLVGDEGEDVQQRRVDESLARAKISVDDAGAGIRLLTDVRDSKFALVLFPQPTRRGFDQDVVR